MCFSLNMHLYFVYYMMQKVKNDQNLKSRGPASSNPHQESAIQNALCWATRPATSILAPTTKFSLSLAMKNKTFLILYVLVGPSFNFKKGQGNPAWNVRNKKTRLLVLRKISKSKIFCFVPAFAVRKNSYYSANLRVRTSACGHRLHQIDVPRHCIDRTSTDHDIQSLFNRALESRPISGNLVLETTCLSTTVSCTVGWSLQAGFTVLPFTFLCFQSLASPFFWNRVPWENR